MTVTEQPDRTEQPSEPDPIALRPADGRTARGQRTRVAVVDALLALHEEGDLAPTAARVAARAGVALRTVYGHFADLEALWLEAGRRELAKISALADVPAPDRPRAERVQRFAASRARTMEALLPVFRASRLRVASSPALASTWTHFVAVGEAEVRAVFATELAALSPADAARLVEGLYLVASAASWEVLRADRGLAVDAAEDVLRHAVAALLPAPGTVPDDGPR